MTAVKVEETVTVTEAFTAANTGFVQARENTVVAARFGEVMLPEVASEPERPSAPVHAVAWVDDQVSVTVLFGRRLAVSAEIIGAGALHAVTLALAFAEPPPPVHVRL
jgi:hypothetical protein